MAITELPGPLGSNQYGNLRRFKRGGMGEIWLAIDSSNGSNVAIKILPVNDPSLEKMLSQEGNIAITIRHPNIVRTHHFGSFMDEGITNFYIVMELADAGSLADLMRRESSPLPMTQAIEYMIQIASGMSEAHKTIVHRDLKPDNILVDSQGLLKIADFGLARYIAATTRSHTCKGWGTYAYMAPECWVLEKNTPRMDIYSMGLIFFELIAGIKPFTATNEMEWRDRHLYEVMPDIRKLREDVPQRLADMIAKMSSKRAEERYPEASAVLTVLNEIARLDPSQSASIDPLISKALGAMQRRQSDALTLKKAQDEAHHATKLVNVAVDDLFSRFANRIEEINGSLEQGRILMTISKHERFRAAFFGKSLEIKFFPPGGILDYISERKNRSLQAQRGQWGMGLQSLIPSVFETERICLVGTISCVGAASSRNEPYAANLVLRKASDDDLYGEWWSAWFDDSALVQKSQLDYHYALAEHEFYQEYEIGKSHIMHIRTMSTRKLEQADIEDYLSHILT